MKVLFIVRSTLFMVRGGDTIQVEETAGHLRKIGVEVDVRKTNDVIDYDRYNLLHFFNIIRPADILVHIKKSGKPFVVSTILVDYSLYDKKERPGFSGKIFRLLPTGTIEYAKTLYRHFSGQEKLVSTSYIWMGQRRSIKTILKKASCVLVQAGEEYAELVRLYQVPAPHAVIQNGVNMQLMQIRKPFFRNENLVLCVARIEGIKNQYNLIKALNNTQYDLLLIGNASPNQEKYYQQCKKIAADNISFIRHLPQGQLVEYYTAAKVHILPSWFEVCGLSSLEAAALGCRVVITGNGYAGTYFGDQAFYCDPSEPESIFQAIGKAATADVNGELQHRILTNYTWEKTAEKTLSVYKNYTE